MIKLAFMVDTAYVLIPDTEDISSIGNKLQNAEIIPQINKISEGDNYAFGKRSAGFYKKEKFKSGTALYLISRNLSEKVKSSSGIRVVNDYMELVQKYKDSRETLTVRGDKEILMLFLPYASEINVVITDKKMPGDVFFKEWKTFNLRLRKINEWSGGITYYYTKKPAPIY